MSSTPATPMCELCNDLAALQRHTEALFAAAPSTGTFIVPYKNEFWRKFHGTTCWDTVTSKLNTNMTYWGFKHNRCRANYTFHKLVGTNGAQDKCEVHVVTEAVVGSRAQLLSAMNGAPDVRTVLGFSGKCPQKVLEKIQRCVRHPDFELVCHNSVEATVASGLLIIQTARRETLWMRQNQRSRRNILERERAEAQDEVKELTRKVKEQARQIKEQARQIELLAERPLKRIKEEPQDDKGSSKRARVD